MNLGNDGERIGQIASARRDGVEECYIRGPFRYFPALIIKTGY